MPNNMHPAIEEELTMLRERFPGKTELNLNEYAEYFGISRRYAPHHFSRINSRRNKICHKKIGKRIIIPVLDFAYWLAQQKVVDGHQIMLPSEQDIKDSVKRRRGFSSRPKYDYRKLG
jgi:hypothetical protein